MDDNASNNGMDDSNHYGGGGDSYPSKLPFWVSANLVVRHPTSKDKETCLACLEELNEEKKSITEDASMDDEEKKTRLADVEQRSELTFDLASNTWLAHIMRLTIWCLPSSSIFPSTSPPSRNSQRRVLAH